MWKVMYKCELVEGSILKSQMKATGESVESFLVGDDETEQEYNEKILKSGFAEIKDGEVTIYCDGE